MASGNARAILTQIAELLENGHDDFAAVMVRDALAGSDQELEKFFISNELWGGAGSLADQALVEDKERRRKLEGLLIQLGRRQIETGKTNVRTKMWVTAFEKWQRPQAG
ncbi:MAG TPA: hypothetical protein VJN43_11875 [Bryobacteraceae bacterium]|nr:hypothetical protein [Bryobacteraceae bacterium]